MCFSSMRFLIGTLLSTTALLAMEPPDPGMIEAYLKDGTLQQKVASAKAMGNHKVGNGLAAHAQYKLQKAAMEKGVIANRVLPEPPPAWKDMPTTGNVKVLTICIDFSDYVHNQTKNSLAQMTDRIFGDGDAEVAAPYESFRQFYLRSSYNQLDFSGNVLGWYRAGYTRASMAQTKAGREKLIKEAIAYYNGGAGGNHDFSQYDNNGDGAIDFFSVIWTGPDTGWSGFWWGYQTSFTDGTFTADGTSFGKYSWQWESRPTGGAFSPKTLIHEQGHGLGLADYYDYDATVGPMGGLGGFDMMDWKDDHNCFSKWLLDWITPTVINTSLTSGAQTLRSAADYQDALVVMPGVSAGTFESGGKSAPFGEFFMVQNRQRTGNDADTYLPGSGLVVWHVDSRLDGDSFDYLYDNSFTEHKLLRLMEADGLEEIEADTSSEVNAGDFYDGGDVFGTTGTPNSARYDGTWTYFGIDTISASLPSMTFNIFTEAADTTPPTGKPSKPTGAVVVDAVTFSWTIGTAADDKAIIGYYLQVGSTSGGSDVFDGRVGDVVSKTLTGLGIWDGQPLYARVRAMDPAGSFTGWSDISNAVTITLPTFSACAALDNCTLTFKTVGSSVPWAADTTDYVAGTSSAAATCADNDQTYLQTTVLGPGILKFRWKASTEKDFDYYSFLIDGTLSERLSGDVAWTQKTMNIASGAHVITWRWAKDSNTGGTVDKVWLDDVQFLYDVNGDGTGSDILDLAWMAWAHGSVPFDTNWVDAADLDNDDDVDNNDIVDFLAASGLSR